MPFVRSFFQTTIGEINPFGLFTRVMNNTKTLGAIAFGFSIAFPLLFPNPAVTTIAVFALIFAGAATGWNILSGFTGYVSLGHAAFYGIGAYFLLLLCQVGNVPGGFIPLLLLPVVGLLTGICALPLGWVALRTKHYTFMVITIAIFVMAAQLPNLLSGIIVGLSEQALPIPLWSGQEFNLPFYYTALFLLLLAFAVSWWIRHTKYGLGLLALRDDEDRARGLGVQVGASKLLAFIVSASFVGMAGAISAYFLGFVSPPSAFDRSLNIAIPLMALLGGAGTLWGPIIGALLVVPLQQFLTLQYGAQGWDLILYGLLLLGVVRMLPEGIIPTFSRRWSMGMNFRHSINAMKSTPFTAQEVTSAVSGHINSSDSLAASYAAVARAQQPERIIISIPHHYVASPNQRRSAQKLRPQRLIPLTTLSSTTSPGQVSAPLKYRQSTQKIRAQRLMPLGTKVPTTSPRQVSAPPLGRPCPRCNEPLGRWDELYFCLRCDLTFSRPIRKQQINQPPSSDLLRVYRRPENTT